MQMTAAIDPAVEETLTKKMARDYAAHNEMVRTLDEKRQAGEAVRNRVFVGFNLRIILADPRLNPEGHGFESMYADPMVHAQMQLRTEAWRRCGMRFDWEMGLPEKWEIAPYPANVHEDALFGAEVILPGGHETPATRPPFSDEDGFAKFMDYPFVSLPTTGHMHRMAETYHAWQERATRGWEYLGRPVVPLPPIAGTDGPFTVACNLFSPDKICLMLLEEPEQLHAILTRLIETTIQRMRETHEHYRGCPKEKGDFGYADDMIAMLSVDSFREAIIPHHRKLVEAFLAPGKNLSIHLCGDSSRHFPILQEELGVGFFDTGFPLDFDNLRDSIGNDAFVSGGPEISFFMSESASLVAETKRVAQSRTALEGPFAMREGNNLPPLVPDENLVAFYETAVASDPRSE